MKSIIVLALLIFVVSNSINAQNIRSIKIDALKNIMSQKDDTLRIVNFWATWCKPCVEELPYFEEANQKNTNQKVKIYLIAVEDELEKVQNFVTKKGMKTEVLYLAEKDANFWIPQIHDKWDGAIPVTFFINNGLGINIFKDGELSKEELEMQIKELLSKQK